MGTALVASPRRAKSAGDRGFPAGDCPPRIAVGAPHGAIARLAGSERQRSPEAQRFIGDQVDRHVLRQVAVLALGQESVDVGFGFAAGKQLGGDASPLADAILDRIVHDSYRINIESTDPTKDISMREVYGMDKSICE